MPRHDLAGDEPVKQVADRGEPLLDARRCELARASLDPRRDVHRAAQPRSTARPRSRTKKFFGGTDIGPARVRVADVGREEFKETHAGALAGGVDEEPATRAS